MKLKILIFIFVFSAGCNLYSQEISRKTWETIRKEFKTIPMSVRPNPLWFWNDFQVEETELKKQMKSCKDAGYGGLSILPYGKDFKPEYLSSEYFSMYKTCVDEAARLGMTLWIYDEYGFPSGSAGLHNADGISRFELKYPDDVLKRLDKEEYIVTDQKEVKMPIPDGVLMAAVAMDIHTYKRIDLSSFIKNGQLNWQPSSGDWKILFFLCRNDEGIVDYLDADAVKKFTEMTHDEYYKHFGDYFGSTLVGTFFDEPTMYRAQGRCWTPSFNNKFKEKYGFSPALYYPALWYDIGEETQEARNYLFGFRSELYAEGYTKVVGDWSRKHGLWATGHQDNEEIVNAVGTSGDLMKCFKHLDAPGIDKIGGNRPAENYYKIVSSAAHNWDHSLVMSETYGAMGNISWTEIFSIAMDQYSKGINLLIPHAVWYNTGNVTAPPELSLRNPIYADSLQIFNNFLARLNAVMQNDARWVGDIAVLYPIHTMQSGHYMDGPLGFYGGGVEIPGLDYIDVGVNLFDKLGHDFMFLHPEVLDEQCIVKENKLFLDNKVQHNAFSAIIIPGCRTISLSNLNKIKAFAYAGGSVIFTTTLPEKATLLGENDKVKTIVNNLIRDKKAVLIENPSTENLGHVVDKLPTVHSVRFTGQERVNNVHKILNGKDIWYFANPGMENKTVDIEMNGIHKLEAWDPHTGETGKKINFEYKNGKTLFSLNLENGKSLFIIEN